MAAFSLPPRLLLPVALGVGGYFARFLTLDGAAAGLVVGLLVVSAPGWGALTLMLACFFLAGSVATKYKAAAKEALVKEAGLPEPDEAAGKSGKGGGGEAKHGRTMEQVLATGGIPAALCLAGHLGMPHWRTMYVAFMCVNCADTLASELGMLSKQKPNLITTGRPVAAGIDGAVTLWGTFCALCGGLLITVWEGSLEALALGALWGVLGSGLDSVMGAVYQAPPAGGSLPFAEWKHRNSLVNAMSCTLVALLAALQAEVPMLAAPLAVLAVLATLRAVPKRNAA